MCFRWLLETANYFARVDYNEDCRGDFPFHRTFHFGKIKFENISKFFVVFPRDFFQILDLSDNMETCFFSVALEI